MAWKKYVRKGGASAEDGSAITIRRNAIAFNAHFMTANKLLSMNYVSVYVDSEDFRLGFRFNESSADPDSLALVKDGGKKASLAGVQSSNRCIQTQGVFTENKWLQAISAEPDGRVRKFTPKWIPAEGLWAIDICPPFEHRVDGKKDIPSEVRGIYRYLHNGKVVYIGRGIIRSRANSPERKDWVFDSIQYSLVPDEKLQAKWETFWIDSFFTEHSRLPEYNRIHGEKNLES